MKDTPKFLRSLKGEPSAIPPVWLMRQAGRYLPEYREVRAQAGSFLDLCYNPDLASEVTLQPIRRYDLDAAILFADILLIPDALGQKVWFEEGHGPRLEPVVTPDLLKSFREKDVVETLAPVFETVRLTRAQLPPEKALIGFAGAPWTVATYMLAGRSLKDPSSLRSHYYSAGSFITELIDILTDKTTDYLIAQIDAGADAVQLFDSWAGGLPWPVLDAVSVRPLERIARSLKTARPHAPVILFPKGVGEKTLEYAAVKHCDAIGIDYAMDPAWARGNISPLKTVQGGLDPMLVVAGGVAMERGVETYLKLFHDVPYVFNLGHGLTPDVPPAHVATLVELIRQNR